MRGEVRRLRADVRRRNPSPSKRMRCRNKVFGCGSCMSMFAIIAVCLALGIDRLSYLEVPDKDPDPDEKCNKVTTTFCGMFSMTSEQEFDMGGTCVTQGSWSRYSTAKEVHEAMKSMSPDADDKQIDMEKQMDATASAGYTWLVVLTLSLLAGLLGVALPLFDSTLGSCGVIFMFVAGLLGFIASACAAIGAEDNACYGQPKGGISVSPWIAIFASLLFWIAGCMVMNTYREGQSSNSSSNWSSYSSSS